MGYELYFKILTISIFKDIKVILLMLINQVDKLYSYLTSNETIVSGVISGIGSFLGGVIGAGVAALVAFKVANKQIESLKPLN